MAVRGFFQRRQWTIVVVYLVAIPLALVGIGALSVLQAERAADRDHDQILEIRRLAVQGLEAHDAICVFRGDLERRVKAGRQYLREHPEGFAGIDPATIRNSLDNQQRTVDSLAAIRCHTKGAS